MTLHWAQMCPSKNLCQACIPGPSRTRIKPWRWCDTFWPVHGPFVSFWSSRSRSDSLSAVRGSPRQVFEWRHTCLRAVLLAPASIVSWCSLLLSLNLPLTPWCVLVLSFIPFCSNDLNEICFHFFFFYFFLSSLPNYSSFSYISLFSFSVLILENWFALVLLKNTCELNLPQLPHK